MIKLTIDGKEKEVANDIEEIRVFFKDYRAKETKEKPKDLFVEVKDDKNTYYFEFEENMLKKLKATIMPERKKKTKEDEETEEIE